MQNLSVEMMSFVGAVYALCVFITYHVLSYLERGSPVSRVRFNSAANFGVALFWWALAIICVSSFTCYGIAKAIYMLTARKGRV